MDFINKRIAVVSTTDDMLSRFMTPHIKYMVEKGAKVDCFCNVTGFNCEELKSIPGVNLNHVSFTRFPFTIKNLKGYKQLKNFFKQNKYDLISCLQPVGGVMGRLVGKKFKVKTLYTAHGFHFYKGCPIQNKLIFKTIEKYCSKYTDALVTMNEEDYLNAQKFKAKKVYKINGIGVDLSKYNPNINFDKQALYKELGISESDFVIMSCGELNKNKNIYRILEAVKNINNPNIKYLVCGEGPLKHEYINFVKENNLEDRIKILGFRKDMPKILSISNLYLMPSFREGLSRAMMEAMSYGLPIVASKIRGNTDLVGNNEGGILCDPSNTKQFEDAIQTLYNNNELAKQYSERNLQFVKNFDLQIVLNQLQKIYEEI